MPKSTQLSLTVKILEASFLENDSGFMHSITVDIKKELVLKIMYILGIEDSSSK